MNDVAQFMTMINPHGILNVISMFACGFMYSYTRSMLMAFLAIANGFWVVLSLFGVA